MSCTDQGTSDTDNVPRFAILLSGKRKSGKDFVADRLTKMIGERLGSSYGQPHVVQLRIAESLKRRYAQIHGVDGDKLMDTSEFKDLHRTRMIEWSENERLTSGDLTQFCRAALESVLTPEKRGARVWIVVDCRRHFEVNYYFLDDSEGRRRGCLKQAIIVRVVASEQTRQSRGWHFIKGADDIDSECGLDDWPKWDFIVENNNPDIEALDAQLVSIVDTVCNGLRAMSP